MSDPHYEARAAQLMKLKAAVDGFTSTQKRQALAAAASTSVRSARPKVDPLESRTHVRLSQVYYDAMDALEAFYVVNAGRSPSRGLLIRRAIEALVSQTLAATMSGSKAKVDAECAALLRHAGTK